MSDDEKYRDLPKHDRAVYAAIKKWPQGPRALFLNAIKRKEESALERLLRENAVSGDGSYVCHAWDLYLEARADVNAAKIAKGKTKPSDYVLFSGSYLAGDASPKDRLSFGPYQIFTFEFDRANDQDFFMKQVEWALPIKTPEASPYGRLHAYLKNEFADFVLLSVVWSGNKSFHIHIAFEVVSYRDRHGEPDVASRQAGHRAHWKELRSMVEDHLQPGAGTRPDKEVGWQTAYRRTPDAIRKITKTGHPLGLTIGSEVRQLVVWEQASKRKKSDMMSLFLSPTRYPVAPLVSPEMPLISSKSLLSVVQIEHVEAHLRAHFSAPNCSVQFSHLDLVSGEYRAMFRNGSDDRTPSSYMSEDYVTPRLVGNQSVDPAEIPPLALPLGQMITIWCSELDQTKGFDPEALKGAYARLSRDLPRYLIVDGAVMIHAQEGIRKSSSVMRLIHLSLIKGQRGRPSIFACSSYTNAESKAREFNFPDRDKPAARRQDGFVGIFWRSATQLYRDTADRLQLPRLTVSDIADAKDKSFWSMVEQVQPDVIKEMRRWHRETMDEIGDRNPVLFTHHEVAFRWRDNSVTRQLFAPDHFDANFDRSAAHEGSRLNWLIVDEVSSPMFVDLFSPAQMDWLVKLRDHSPKIWAGGALDRQLDHFDKHASAMKGDAGIDIFLAQRALSAGLEDFTSFEVRDSEEYPLRGDDTEDAPQGRPIYRPYACDGDVYFRRRRDWWQDGEYPTAATVVMTTTEAVPAAVAREVMLGLVYYAPDLRVGRDSVDVYASRKIIADNIPAITADYQGKPDIHIISNKLGEIDNATNHFEARGANDLADQNIVQVVTMFPPSQYGQLRAIGTWLGQDDLVRLAHIDQINQSCGRNRGPRNRGADHLLLISLNLYRILNACPTAMKELRYSFRTKVDATQRANAKKKIRFRTDQLREL